MKHTSQRTIVETSHCVTLNELPKFAKVPFPDCYHDHKQITIYFSNLLIPTKPKIKQHLACSSPNIISHIGKWPSAKAHAYLNTAVPPESTSLFVPQ